MLKPSLPAHDDNTIEGTVTIQRPVKEVFEFYRDFNNLPSFLGDVMAVEKIGPSIFRWTIQGPLGIRVKTMIKVTEVRTNNLMCCETAGIALLSGSWEIHFDSGPDPDETEVRSVMRMPFGRLGRAALALIGKFPAKEVSSNLNRLKELIETGRVTDTSYSVAGKFG